MITKPTTLILGAGASAPFGFPTGYDLLRQVLLLDATNDLFGSHLHIQVQAFKEALSKSGATSVDAFLEHRPEFIQIGKTAIAIALIAYESEDRLFSLNENDDNWYQYLFNQLNTKFDDFEKNKLNILTFNYDRSLEHYLFTCLKNKYGKSIEECADKIRSIPIIHLHGDLGELPYLFGTASMRPYNTKLTDETVRVASQRIRIIHEGIANEPQFAQAQKILSESQHICFLGFGYHHLNIKRLGFKDTGGYAYRATLWGSTKGFTYEELNHLSRRFSGQLKFSNYGSAIGRDVLAFLRETTILQMAS